MLIRSLSGQQLFNFLYAPLKPYLEKNCPKPEYPLNSLKNILSNKINTYLQYDNPEPKTFSQQVGSLFARSGAAGRARAREYQEKINAAINPDELINKIYKDLFNEDGNLKESFYLRERMLEGLCEYMGYNQDDIQKLKDITILDIVTGMEKLVQFKMNPSSIERRGFRFGNNEMQGWV